MKRVLLFATIISAILFCVGCTSVKTIVINVQKPAQITLPQNIENIGIINNAVPQPHNWGHVDSDKSAKQEQVSVPSDSIIPIFAETLFENLIDLNLFNNVALYEVPLRNDTDFLTEMPIDSVTAKEICDITHSDAIVSIDRLLIGTSSFNEAYDYTSVAKFLDAKVDVRFRIYSKKGSQIANPLYYSDSIYWAGLYNRKDQILGDSIPPREQAVKEAAIFAAEKIAGSLSSTWIEEVRLYYGDVKSANKKVEVNDWQAALDLWKKAFDSEIKPKKKARIAYNIALAYELSDNIKEAIRWSNTAVKLFEENAQTNIDQTYLTRALAYQAQLIERQQDFKILNIRK